jgi:hypothetical protein
MAPAGAGLASRLVSAWPRRGDGSAPRRLVPKASETAFGLYHGRDQAIRAVLADAQTEEHLRAAGVDHLGGAPTPLGAAVVHAAATNRAFSRDAAKYDVVADHWIAEWGVVFAAAAVVHLSRLQTRTTGRWDDRRSWLLNGARQLDWRWPGEQVAERVSTALAHASDEDYAAAVAAVGALRTTVPARVVAAYLLPTEDEWVDEVVAAARSSKASAEGRLALCSVREFAPMATLLPLIGVWSLGTNPRTIATIAKAGGPALAPTFDEWIGQTSADLSRTLLAHLATFPTEEAMGILVRRAGEKLVPPFLQEAVTRFPLRGARLLAEAIPATKDSAVLETVLTALVLARPGVADRVEVSAKARAVLDRIAAANAERHPVADLAELPPVLADPPWLRKRSTAKPVVVEGLEPRGGSEVVWADGERAAWEQSVGERDAPHIFRREPNWDELFRRFGRDSDEGYWGALPLMVLGPVERARALLLQWRPGSAWWMDEWGRGLVARAGGLRGGAPTERRLARSEPDLGRSLRDHRQEGLGMAFGAIERTGPSASLSTLLQPMKV